LHEFILLKTHTQIIGDAKTADNLFLAQAGDTRFRDIGIVCAACLLLLLPFVGKPFHVDDPMYLWTARQIAAKPLDFYGFTVNWDRREQPIIEVMKNPPLVSYFIAGAAMVVGWSETALHSSFLLFSLIAMVGMYLLAAHFCRQPLAVVFLMLLCPSFLVSATTLMCEVPLICFWIWAVLLWIRGSEQFCMLLPVAGLMIAAATLTKYSAVNLLPLLAAYSLLNPAPRHTKIVQCISWLIPIAVLAGYEHFTFVRYGRGLLSDAIGYSSDANKQTPVPVDVKLLDALIFVGGGASAVAILAVTFMGWRVRLTVFFSAVLFALVAIWRFSRPGGWENGSAWLFYLQCGIFSAGGIAIAIICFDGALRMFRQEQWRNCLFFLLWIGGIFVFTVFFNWAINARSLLPLLPPVCILAQRAIEQRGRKALGPFMFAMLASGLLVLAVAIADYQLAQANRWAAGRLAKSQAVNMVSASQVWFSGHWGFQYYMQELGARRVDDRNPEYRPGDLLILPLNNYGVSPTSGGLKLLDTLEAGTFPWLTTMNGAMGANLYYSPGDRLPFVAGQIPSEAYLILQVTRSPAPNVR
jgi:4-amino-4-deoxy-L-arabinose transferase-like glycosyltransferase